LALVKTSVTKVTSVITLNKELP